MDEAPVKVRVEFYRERGLLKVGDERRHLAPQVANLFDLLLKNKGQPVTFAEIEAAGMASAISSIDPKGNMKGLVKELRRKLIGTGLSVKNRYGIGFELELSHLPGETPLGLRVQALFGWLRMLEPVA